MYQIRTINALNCFHERTLGVIFKEKIKNPLQIFIIADTIPIPYFQKIMTPEAERFNGWAAMLGFVAAVGAYVTTGQIIPGWF